MDNCTECGRALTSDQELCTVCGTPRPGFEPTLMRKTPVPPESPPAAAPRRVPEGVEVLDGKWALEQEIGRGGMGTVYLATDLDLDRKVAIKMLALSMKQEPEVVSRFEREARMLARLEHPNMVPIYAVGRKDGLPFIVMKNLEGSSLAAYLRERGRLPLEEVLAITRQLCAGLGFIHAKGIIHRDIKPGNIFVGPDGHVTLLDLGVAHDSNQSLTKSGLLIGTPRYMSPEQILYGSGRIDYRSDLYALAVVLFEMLTGAPVFDGESDFSVMRAHTDLAPPDPATFVPDLPQPVGLVLQKALAKQPQDRYAGAGELLTALEAAVTAQSTAPIPLTRPAVAPVREKHTPPTLTPVTDRVERPAPTDASLIAAAGLQRRSKGPAIAVAVLAGVAVLGVGGYLALGRSDGPKPLPEEPVPAAPARAPAPTNAATPVSAGAPTNAAAPTVAAPIVEAPAAAAPSTAAPTAAAPGTAAPAAAAPAGTAATAVPTMAAPTVAPAADAKNPAPAGAVSPATGTRTAAASTGTGTTPAAATAEPKPVAKTPEREAPAARAEHRESASARPTEVRVTTTLNGASSWAWLDVDGIRKGNTPLILKLAPGTHQLRISRTGFKTLERTVEVVSGHTVRLTMELEK